MKNSIKFMTLGLVMLFSCSLFAQDRTLNNNTTDSARTDKMIQEKKTGTKYSSDSLQMNKNKSKTDQKNMTTPSGQPKRDSSDIDPHRMRTTPTSPVVPPDTVK